jgi:hypothetical protein
MHISWIADGNCMRSRDISFRLRPWTYPTSKTTIIANSFTLELKRCVKLNCSAGVFVSLFLCCVCIRLCLSVCMFACLPVCLPGRLVFAWCSFVSQKEWNMDEVIGKGMHGK